MEIDPDAICYLQKRNAKIGTRHYRNLEKRGITKAYTCWIYAVRTAAGLKFSTWAWLWLIWENGRNNSFSGRGSPGPK